MDREEVIIKLQELAHKLETKTLTQKDIRSSKVISEYWIRQHFDTLAKAVEAAGLKPTKLAKTMSTSDDELLEYLGDLQRRLHRQPKIHDINRNGRFSVRVFENRFGSIPNALLQLSARVRTHQLDAGTDEKGAAAEFLVVAELLYRGFNANFLPVDRGIDIVAMKENKSFNIQVKNVSFEKGNGGDVAITASAYKRHRAGNVFYIFVLIGQQDRHFLILPFHKVDELIKSNVIEAKDPALKKLRIKIIRQEDQLYINKKSEKAEISSYLNAWDQIV